MIRWLSRAALAVALAWGVWSTAYAGDPALDPPKPPPLYPKTPAWATELPPGVPPAPSTPCKHPLWDWCRHGRPLCCWASFNGYSCGSLHSDLAFVFGSCRTFYGQPCLKSAPPSPLPPWTYYGAPGAPPPGTVPGAGYPGGPYPGGPYAGGPHPGGPYTGPPPLAGGCNCAAP